MKEWRKCYKPKTYAKSESQEMKRCAACLRTETTLFKSENGWNSETNPIEKEERREEEKEGGRERMFCLSPLDLHFLAPYLVGFP